MKKHLLIGLLTLGTAVSVHAVATIRLTTDGGATVVTVVDGGAGDTLAGTTGAVLYGGPVGGTWVLNITTGVTYPAGGLTAGVPFISIDTSSTSVSPGVVPSPLRIEFSEVGFTGLDGYQIQYGGTVATGGGSLNSYAYADTANTLFTQGTLLGSLLGSTGAYSSTGYAPGVGTTPYSLTLVMDLTHPSGVATSTPGITLASVPEGGSTLVLLGAGLLGIGALIRKGAKS